MAIQNEGLIKKGFGPVNILIVEDEALIALDLRMTLERLGFTVLGMAFSGEESLRKVESLRPNLVFMDIKLRGDMDGVMAAEEIARRFRIPVVYLTAYTDPQTLLRIGRLGSFRCLHKPFEPGELLDSISRSMAISPA